MCPEFASPSGLHHNARMSHALTSLKNAIVRSAAGSVVRVLVNVILSVVVVVVLPDRPAAA